METLPMLLLILALVLGMSWWTMAQDEKTEDETIPHIPLIPLSFHNGTNPGPIC